MTRKDFIKYNEFLELAKKYEDLWRKADVEKEAEGKIRAKTRRELARIADLLNA